MADARLGIVYILFIILDEAINRVKAARPEFLTELIMRILCVGIQTRIRCMRKKRIACLIQIAIALADFLQSIETRWHAKGNTRPCTNHECRGIHEFMVPSNTSQDFLTQLRCAKLPQRPRTVAASCHKIPSDTLNA